MYVALISLESQPHSKKKSYSRIAIGGERKKIYIELTENGNNAAKVIEDNFVRISADIYIAMPYKE